MKYRLLRIDSPDDIDTSKISVYDLNNRYIDTEGKMYGLKLDRLTHKIMVVQILRTTPVDAPYYMQKLREYREQGPQEVEDIPSTADTGSDEQPETEREEESVFDPDKLIERSLEYLSAHRERLKGITLNVKQANLISQDDKNETTRLDDIFRTLDLDGSQKMEELENYYRELTNYPRSITYYQAKVDSRGREILDALSGETSRSLKFVKLYEMLYGLKAIYGVVLKAMRDLKALIAEKSEGLDSAPQQERQAIEDARTSIENTIEESQNIMDNLDRLEAFVYEPDNFS